MKGLVVAHRRFAPVAATRPAGRAAALACVGNQPLIMRSLDTLTAVGVDAITVLCEPGGGPTLRSAIDGWSAAEIDWVESDGGGDLSDAIAKADERLGSERFVVHVTNGLWLEHQAALREALRDSDDDALLFLTPGAGREAPLPVPVVAGADSSVPEQIETGAGLGGIQCFGPAMLDVVRSLRARHTLSLTAAIDTLIDEGGTVATRVAEGWCSFDGGPDDLLALNRAALNQLPGSRNDGVCERSQFTGRLEIHRTARIVDSVLRGPVIIGADARISDAYIGPHTVVGDAAVVQNAEIEASVLLTGARVQNVGERIDSSVIGQGARVTRDFELPRALRLVLGDDAQVRLR